MATDIPVPAPADNVTSSQNTAELTTAERAAAVISHGQITLHRKLAICTVLGTNEPRVVRLFPTTTCSCPARADCYHILAARTAIGVTKQFLETRDQSYTAPQEYAEACGQDMWT